MPIRVWVADDHAVFRYGLCTLLKQEKDIEVVGESENGFDTIRSVGNHAVDVLVLDLSMPGLPGMKVAEVVREEHPKIQIVVLTMYEGGYYVRQGLKIGVTGYVLKRSAAREVVRAIRLAYRGERFLDPCLGNERIADEADRLPHPSSNRLGLLTPREREVCRLLALGNTNAQIADELCISKRTVESHRANLMAKLELNSRAELVQFAIENSLFKTE